MIRAMALLHRIVVNVSKFSKCPVPAQKVSPLTVRKLPLNQHHFTLEKEFHSSPAKFKDKEIPSSLSKYEIFPEKITPEILDVEEERQKISEDKVINEFEGISLECGTTGVIDVEEIVALLKREKAQDIFVVKVPQQYNYADYKVIVTGKSQRHMLAMIEFVRRLYKRRVNNNQIPRLEGKTSKLWMAIDLGNVVLHVFSDEGRKIYDLETLWSVGREYDSLSQDEEYSSIEVTDYAQILASLTPKTSGEETNPDAK